jgi:hypothetical protein
MVRSWERVAARLPNCSFSCRLDSVKLNGWCFTHGAGSRRVKHGLVNLRFQATGSGLMADNRDIPKGLTRQWVHSFEEDTDTEEIYRPANYNFPPARGRTGFELKADQTCRRLGIASTDGSQLTEGTWQVDGGSESTLRVDAGGTQQELTIVSVEPERLVVRKPRTE